MSHKRHSFALKRAFDFLVSLCALLALAPILGALAFLVMLRMGRPILFRQRRPGLDGKLFTIYKFRTMAEGQTNDGSPLPDHERLTGFGAFLRAWSLDELPELWNVLRGDMSLVGPRPLHEQYLARYSLEHARRHDVRPGITGWAQVNGRNTTSWEQRFDLDVWYVDNWSFWLDIRICLRTIAVVVSRTGINAPGHATMPEYRG